MSHIVPVKRETHFLLSCQNWGCQRKESSSDVSDLGLVLNRVQEVRQVRENLLHVPCPSKMGPISERPLSKVKVHP